MSNLVYPTLPGLDFGVSRDAMAPPVAIKTTPSLREYRGRDSTFVRYAYSLSYEFLRSAAAYNELQTLVGFYNLVGGPFDSFLFTDPDDSVATAMQFAVGNGASTVFQLTRSFGGFAEAIYDFNGGVSIFDNGVNVGGGATVSSTGVLTFSTAPAAGHSLTWTGNYYRRCRFTDPKMSAEKFMANLWNSRKVQFMSTQS
jgi:hypothetical protein